eukprot:6455660-Amphidinium_carterae.1
MAATHRKGVAGRWLTSSARLLDILLCPAWESPSQQVLRSGILPCAGVDSATEGLGDAESKADFALMLSGKQCRSRGPAPRQPLGVGDLVRGWHALQEFMGCLLGLGEAGCGLREPNDVRGGLHVPIIMREQAKTHGSQIGEELCQVICLQASEDGTVFLQGSWLPYVLQEGDALWQHLLGKVAKGLGREALGDPVPTSSHEGLNADNAQRGRAGLPQLH